MNQEEEEYKGWSHVVKASVHKIQDYTVTDAQ